MSPLSLRRYRAERLLHADFERLRGSVLALVQRRLLARGGRVDRADLDAAYSHAWHGLYAEVLEGRGVENPVAWLATVTLRRAVDEHRSRVRARSAGVPLDERSGAETRDRADRARVRALDEPDLASALDDRILLRQLMEALRARLSNRELEAASLCYLQGLPRAQAAARMGVSESAMRRLMDGRRGRPGVAQKFGSLVGTIDSGRWCSEQGSLMRGLAYGILDPGGERYQLALSHHRECPACRSYVLSLRGLASVLPPAPLLLRLAVGGAGVSGIGTAGAGTAGAGAGAGGASGAGAMGAVSATGAAGGGWLIAGAGSAATKLAVGCLLALGVGAGCMALGGTGRGAKDASHAHAHAHRASAGAHATPLGGLGASVNAAISRGAQARARTHIATLAASRRAPREFGLEGAGAVPTSRAAAEASAPRALSAAVTPARDPQAGTSPSTPSRSAEPSATAAREFGPE